MERGDKMKKITIFSLAGLLLLAFSAVAMAHYEGWGHMRDYKGHMGDYRGHMHDYRDYRYDDRDYGRYQGYCWNYPDKAKAIDSSEAARAEVERYLKTTRNPNLKAGEITELEEGFEVNIETKEGSLADKVLVEKKTGRLIPVYR
jgi:hypothetical protein